MTSLANLHALSKKISEDVAGGVKRISEEVAGGAKAVDLASFAAERKKLFASCKEIIASSAAESKELNRQLYASIASSSAESRELNRQLNASCAANSKQQAQLRVSVKSLEESVKAMVRKCTSFDNWQRGHTDNLEVLVLACLRKHLMEQQGLEEEDILELGCRKVERLDGFLERGFEWDGVIYIPSEEPKLYLFEGKSSANSDDITKMGERMLRTADYIASCSAKGSLQALEASAGYQILKAGPKAMHSRNRETWAKYRGCKVIGAIGGVGFRSDMLTMASKAGLLVCVPSEVLDPV